MQLDASAIASMRATMDTLLPDVCTIRRKTTANEGGEETEDWANLATAVPCRIRPIGGGESAVTTRGTVGGRIVDETTHLITFTAEQDVEEADRIILDGTTFDVTLVRKRGSWELSRRVEVVEA